MSEPENLILAHLRELRADMPAESKALRAEMNAHFAEMDQRFAAVEARLDKLDAAALKFMRNFIGLRSMTERTFASFEIQPDQLEARVAKLERARA